MAREIVPAGALTSFFRRRGPACPLVLQKWRWSEYPYLLPGTRGHPNKKLWCIAVHHSICTLLYYEYRMDIGNLHA
jgi:hypothetical protein